MGVGGDNLDSISRTLRRCGRTLAVESGRSLHSQLIKNGLCSIVFLANNLISMYADLGRYDDAHKLFDEMPDRNVVSWTAAISAHTHAGNPANALQVFTQILDSGSVEPNNFTFSAALKACALVGNLGLGKWIHENVLRARMQSDTVLMNAVLDMYVKCGGLAEARSVFDSITMLNSTSWNTMIAGYARWGDMVKAEKLFSKVPKPDAISFNTMIAGFAQAESPRALSYVCMMQEQGVRFDYFTFPCALKTCGSLRFERLGTQMHCCIIKYGFEFDPFIGPSVIDMYSKCGRVNEATQIYDEQLRSERVICDKLPLLNSMVSGFAINRYDVHAFHLIHEIHSSGIGPDAYTLSSALKVCTNLQNLRIGMQVHCLIVTTGCHADYIVGSALVDLYAKCGKLEVGKRLFVGLSHKDVVSWSGLLAGCVQEGSNQLAFALFRDMVSLNIEMDQFVVSSILKACSVMTWSEGGRHVHGFSIKRGFEYECVMIASLIDMYSKCGEVEDGLRVFESASEKDTVCWTGMIVGCGYNGRAMEAIRLFQEMLKSGEMPNEVTFLGVLSACRHAGLVREACLVFKVMANDHRLIPCLEHYCCMVDILSRAGLYDEVEQLISHMPYEPDETLWKLMLGSSIIHWNTDIGKLHVVEELLHSTTDASWYVTLSNIYASLGMWNVSARIRQISQRTGLKESGRSWIEARN